MAINFPALGSKLVKTAFGGLATKGGIMESLMLPVLYKHVTDSTYAASTGVVTPVGADYQVRAFFGAYKAREIDGEKVRRNDRKVMVPASFFDDFRANLSDVIVAGAGASWLILSGENLAGMTWGDFNFTVPDAEHWRVLDYKLDVTQSLWTFQCRKEED